MWKSADKDVMWTWYATFGSNVQNINCEHYILVAVLFIQEVLMSSMTPEVLRNITQVIRATWVRL